jgi:hypothetical protein
MTQLKDALQFVFLTLIARLIGYVIVRTIELFKPRSIHFIIAPASRNKTPPDMDQFKPGRKHFAKQTEKAFYLREWGRMLKFKVASWFIAARKRCHSRCGPKRRKLTVKLITEIVGLLTALASLTILLLDYFLR